MPIHGVLFYGHNNGSKGSNTPGFSNLTDLYGFGNGSTPAPGFGNHTLDTGTDLHVDGSGGQEWILIPILFVVFLLILIGSVCWVSNFIFFAQNKVNILLEKKSIFYQQKYIKKVPYFTCLKCLDLY